MKYLIFITFVFIGHVGLFAQDAAADMQSFFIRPQASIGLGTLFGTTEAGLSQFYGIRALIAAGPTQRFGLELSWADQAFGTAASSIRSGIVLEQLLFDHFHMAIGTIGYLDLEDTGLGNPVAMTTSLGYESSIGPVHWLVGFQSDFVFYERIMNSNGIIFGIWL